MLLGFFEMGRADGDFDAGIEMALFLDSQIRENHSVLELLTSDQTFVNQRLAEHYDIPNIYGNHFRRITLDGALDPRRGLLGKVSLLTVTSYAHRTSPVVRGKWLLENVLGTPPPGRRRGCGLRAAADAGAAHRGHSGHVRRARASDVRLAGAGVPDRHDPGHHVHDVARGQPPDHMLMLYGCGISDGNQHLHVNLPILLAGGAGGRLRGGRHLRVADETPLTNLQLTLLDKVGVPTEQLGDSTGQLTHLADV